MRRISGLLSVIAIAASGAAARAEPTDPFQFAVSPGTSANGQDVIRTVTTTGQSILCAESTVCIPIAEPAPPGDGSYRISTWALLDTTVARRVWNLVRYDVTSGRIWGLNYDGKAASWVEFTYPTP